MYRVKHRKFYRTRVTFPDLRGQCGPCRRVQMQLEKEDGVDAVFVRSSSGSVIVEHASGPLSLAWISRVVSANILNPGKKNGSDTCTDAEVGLERCTNKGPLRNHVSGTTLVLTGVYLFYLGVKRLGGTLLGTRSVLMQMANLPSLLAVYHSLPIGREAVDNLKKTHKPDMGMISVVLLYCTLAMGNAVAALVVFWLFNLSNWLETRIRVKTRRAVREMLSGKVDSVWLVRDGLEIEIDATDLVPGDVVILQKGSSVPADGTVLRGRAIINESILTGEELPVEKLEGDTLFTGTMIEDGDVQLKVSKTGESTRLAAILKLIENAEQDIGELQRTSQNLSRKLVPFSLSLAGVTLLLTANPVMAMSVLIITCPCALRLSTSVTVSMAISNAAASGIFVKGGRYVEIAGKVNVLVVDKTGTVTDPVAEVRSINVIDDQFSEEEILQLAASVQRTWKHPLGRAVIRKARSLGIARLNCEKARLLPGKGIEATINNQLIIVGNSKFLEENMVTVGIPLQTAEFECLPGKSQLYLAVDGRLVGSIEIGSHIKEGMHDMIDQLKALGIKRVVLLTGDCEDGIKDIRKQMNFDEILCEQSPEDKAGWISGWKKQYPEDVVAMVGDGINDTPAFAAADLSLAVGKGGADIAVEYADVVLQDGDARQVVTFFSSGRRAVRLIYENHALAIGCNSLALGLMLAGTVTPVGGALLHNIITVAAVTNGASMLSYKISTSIVRSGYPRLSREVT